MVIDYHIDFFLMSEETWSTILTFFFQGPRRLSLPFLTFLFTEAKPTTYFSDREGIAYHNDQSGKATPLIPNGEGPASHSETIIKFK